MQNLRPVEQNMKIEAFKPKILNISIAKVLFTFWVVKDIGVLPVSPTTMKNVDFGTFSSSIFFLNGLEFREKFIFLY